MIPVKTNVTYTIAMCELLDELGNCVSRECRVNSYGNYDTNFTIAYHCYKDTYELCILKDKKYYILQILLTGNSIADKCNRAYNMFVMLCCDRFISSFIELYLDCRTNIPIKEYKENLRFFVEDFLVGRDYYGFKVEIA